MQGEQQRIIRSSETTGDCQHHWCSYSLWDQVALLTLNGRGTKPIPKKIHHERSTTGSQIAGNSTFRLYPNSSVKCNKTRILQAILPPGLPVANCIIISVCGCHLLPPSQGLVHNKRSFLIRLLTPSRAECLIKSQDETFIWVFTESLERASNTNRSVIL